MISTSLIYIYFAIITAMASFLNGFKICMNSNASFVSSYIYIYLWYSLVKPHKKMSDIADGEYRYGPRGLNQSYGKYEDSIYIGGRSHIVCFNKITDYLVSDTW